MEEGREQPQLKPKDLEAQMQWSPLQPGDINARGAQGRSWGWLYGEGGLKDDG